MSAPTIAKRVERLENTMNGSDGVLEQIGLLRSDVDSFRSEFLQFRDETRAKFYAIRKELRGEVAGLHGEMAGLRGETGDLRDQVTDLRTHMLVLHEEVLARFALLQEGLNRRQ